MFHIHFTYLSKFSFSPPFSDFLLPLSSSLLPPAPTLTLSTDLLVVNTNVGTASTAVACTPSDTRAPVQWTDRTGGLPTDFSLSFSPPGLNHMLTIESAPDRVETLFCDLMDLDRPGEPISPQELTVRFISGI